MPSNTTGADLTINQVERELFLIADARAAEARVPLPEMTYKLVVARPDGNEVSRGGKELMWHGACLYAHGDKPGCIIGQWLNLHGVTTDELKLWEGENGNRVAVEFMPQTPNVVLDFLTTVQTYQDKDMTWLGAIEQAKKEIPDEHDPENCESCLELRAWVDMGDDQEED